MTTEAQKQTETRYVEAFLRGLIDYESLDPCEPPDFWVRLRTPPYIAPEVVEYHPNTDGGIRRTQVEATWWKNLQPLIISKCTSIKDVSVHFDVNEKFLPTRKDCQSMATDLVRLVEAVIGNPNFQDDDTMVEFAPKATLPAGNPGMVFLPEEEWPVADTLLSLMVSRHPGVPIPLPLWHCLNAAAVWVGPEADELTGYSTARQRKHKNASSAALRFGCSWFGRQAAT